MSWIWDILQKIWHNFSYVLVWNILKDHGKPKQCISNEELPVNVAELPEECLQHIFQYLGQVDLVRSAAVCKQWHVAIQARPSLWETTSGGQISFILRSPENKENANLVRYYTDFIRSQKYIDFLQNIGIKVKNLQITVDKIDQLSFDTIARFLACGSSDRLRSLNLRWCDDENHGISEKDRSEEFESTVVLFLSVLSLLNTFCLQLKRLDCQFNWTTDSVGYISSMHSLTHLSLTSMPRIHRIQKWHIDHILSSLKNLKSLKLCVTILPKSLQKFSFISDSLETLDISDCVHFMITAMNLPNLKTLIAKNLVWQWKALPLYTTCLFDAIENGCPALETITSNSDYLVFSEEGGLNLTDDEKVLAHLCFCKKHIYAYLR